MGDAPTLGDRVREVVSGDEGVVTGVCEYLWGCQQCLVYLKDQRNKDGDPKSVWWDIGRLEVIERGVVKAIEYTLAFSGPDREAPTR